MGMDRDREFLTAVSIRALATYSLNEESRGMCVQDKINQGRTVVHCRRTQEQLGVLFRKGFFFLLLPANFARMQRGARGKSAFSFK